MTQPTLLTLPTEIRLQIYAHLLRPATTGYVYADRDADYISMVFNNVGPFTLYRNRKFTTPAMLIVCKQIRRELDSVLEIDLQITLYIYIILNQEKVVKIGKGEFEEALAALRSSRYFLNIRHCIIDIRIVQGGDLPAEQGGVQSYNFGSRFPPVLTAYLEDTCRSIASTLLLVPEHASTEIAWTCYVRGNPAKAIQQTKQAFNDKGIAMDFVEREVFLSGLKGIFHTCKSLERDWPDKLRPFRKLEL